MREEKDKTYPDTPSGMPGVQTLVTLLLDHVNKGNMTLARFVDLTAHEPQRIFRHCWQKAASPAAGTRTSHQSVDMNSPAARLKIAGIASRCGWTPFDA